MDICCLCAAFFMFAFGSPISFQLILSYLQWLNLFIFLPHEVIMLRVFVLYLESNCLDLPSLISDLLVLKFDLLLGLSQNLLVRLALMSELVDLWIFRPQMFRKLLHSLKFLLLSLIFVSFGLHLRLLNLVIFWLKTSCSSWKLAISVSDRDYCSWSSSIALCFYKKSSSR